jgi:hypothetical protein
MKIIDIPYLRLYNQQIIGSKFRTPKEIVGWMGAMQAQDFGMSKWAVGVRLDGSTDQTIASAIDKGEIIRTHLMRPTWHLIASDDIYWMLELTVPQIKGIMKFRDKVLELDPAIYEKTNFIIANALQGGKHLSREELTLELEMANIPTDYNKVSHFLMRAEINELVCSGKTINNKSTFALLSERVPHVKRFSREESASKLALSYFLSHGPAILQDFIWWSGLPITLSRHALESIKSKLVSEKVENQTFWFSDSISIPAPDKNTVFLLPAYDEFTISYRDRTVSLTLEMHRKAISSNGIFRPIVVINGEVVGLWRKTTQKDKIRVEVNLFQPVGIVLKELIEETTVRYGNYLNKNIELVIVNQ